MSQGELKALRGVLALIWLVTGALSFGLYPVADSLVLLQKLELPDQQALLVLYAGAAADVVLGLLTLTWPRSWLWVSQLVLIAAYTLLATWLVPEYWLHPFGPLLKNLAVVVVICLLYRHDPERRQMS